MERLLRITENKFLDLLLKLKVLKCKNLKRLQLYERNAVFLNSPNQPWSHAARQSEGPRAASGGRAVNVMDCVPKNKKN